ncbi:hypothetical protein [Caloranaerobacter ferrireducens]|uniref:hypothetical protein n=1 Tax=Caloranaerobacter ferrireducens TaxID=1323370 RepID=UPI00159F1CD8|nr:hypothetical protein [Caloranaerobacter ferrireducens]
MINALKEKVLNGEFDNAKKLIKKVSFKEVKNELKPIIIQKAEKMNMVVLSR